MDEQRFDALARGLGSGSSRRSIFMVLRAAMLAGTVSLPGRASEQADAKKNHHGRQQAKRRGRGDAENRKRRGKPAAKDGKKRVIAQKNDKNTKVGICHRTGSETNPYEYIEVDKHAVPAHQEHGDVVGVDLQSDPNNCGTCGNVCGGDVCNTPVCQNGNCGTTAVVCDDKNPCTDDSCDVNQGGCVVTPNTAACTTAAGKTGICGGGICVETFPVSCNRPLQRERARVGGGTAGTNQCQTSEGCEQTIQVNLVGATPNTAFDVYIDQDSRGGTFHISAGTLTTDGSGNATFQNTIVVAGTCPRVVDNELVLKGAVVGEHQYIQNSFVPCRICT